MEQERACLQATTSHQAVSPSRKIKSSQLGQLYLICYSTYYMLPNLEFGIQMKHYGTLVWCENCGLQVEKSDKCNNYTGCVDLFKAVSNDLARESYPESHTASSGAAHHLVFGLYRNDKSKIYIKVSRTK